MSASWSIVWWLPPERRVIDVSLYLFGIIKQYPSFGCNIPLQYCLSLLFLFFTLRRMDAYSRYLNGLITKNKTDFAAYPGLKWINPYSSQEYLEVRDRYLSYFSESSLFKSTKPFHMGISPGCKICGNGEWSCLFITGKCNAACFYCPAKQAADEVPVSQGLTFPDAGLFASYIGYFGFRGVGFSGGEPLLFPERVISYLKELLRKSPYEVYTWAYTNGIRGHKQLYHELADAGLNEMRFDIGATGWSLDALRSASGVINTISVEVPAIPEETGRMKKLLPAMVKAGVNYLNLHQLRLTPHNVRQLSSRNYTYIPAEKPVVAESELAAFEIMDYARMHDIELGINYCSFYFKNRFQPAGFRKQLARKLAEPGEYISEKGFVRNVEQHSLSYSRFKLAVDGAPQLSSGKPVPGLPRFSFQKEPAHKIMAADSVRIGSISHVMSQKPVEIPSDQELFDCWQYEFIEKGLRSY